LSKFSFSHSVDCFGQMFHGAVVREEAEGEDGLIFFVLTPFSGETFQLLDVSDRQSHVSFGTPDFEVEVIAVLLGRAGKVKLDACKGESERNSLVVHGARPLDGKRSRGHGHPHEHCGESFQHHFLDM